MKRNYQTASPDRYGLLKYFAIENRKHATEAESLLWQYLKGGNLGVKFKRQHVIYDYIADFICLDKQLIIEVDGGYHFTEEQQQQDWYRTADLEKIGYKVIRFKNEEVMFETDKVIKEIKKHI